MTGTWVDVVAEIGARVNEVELLPEERANEAWIRVQKHLGPHRVDVALQEEALSVHEHDDGSISFHTQDRALTLILFPSDVVVRQLRHGQHKELTYHRAGEILRGRSILASDPSSN